jgi:uncharacterized protein YbcI
MPKTKGQLEAEISDAMVKFELDYMGRGPEEAKTYLLDDMVIVRLRGVLTQAEKQLAQSAGSSRGLVKEMRRELLDKARPLLETIINDVTGQEVRSVHTDLSTRTGERLVVFTLLGQPVYLRKPDLM